MGAVAAILAVAIPGAAQPAVPPVVAEGEGLVVTAEDVLRRARVLAALLGVAAGAPGAEAYVLRLAAGSVQHLVNLVLVEWHAAQEGVRPDLAEVERRVALAERRMGGPQALLDALGSWGLTPGDLRRELGREVLWEAYLDRFARRAVILEEFARRLFDDNRDRFRVPDRFYLVGVVFRERRPAEEFRRAVLRGVDFVGLARRVVGQPFLQAAGGDLGWLGEARMQPWVLQAVQRLRVGEVSPVFGGPPGWYVIRLEAFRPGRLLGYEEARPALLEDMRRSSALTDLYILVGLLRRELGVRVTWPVPEGP